MSPWLRCRQLPAFDLHGVAGLAFIFLHSTIVKMNHPLAAVRDAGIVRH